ncbi:MAG: hypothetical protein QM612_04965 [Thermomonas sp.]|uniref:hypothetical protein n=1 Tax=Thermomonas sp. TaxID=1971895 RepID=UPI0039E262CD
MAEAAQAAWNVAGGHAGEKNANPAIFNKINKLTVKHGIRSGSKWRGTGAGDGFLTAVYNWFCPQPA